MPLLVSSGPGAPTPTPTDLGSRHFALGVRDALLGQRDQPVHHVARARLRVGRLAREGVQGAAVLGDAPHDQVGPADVNAEYESHADPPLPDHRLTASATVSTASSRMQR